MGAVLEKLGCVIRSTSGGGVEVRAIDATIRRDCSENEGQCSCTVSAVSVLIKSQSIISRTACVIMRDGSAPQLVCVCGLDTYTDKAAKNACINAYFSACR